MGRFETLFRSPVVHFVLLGSLLFVASTLREPPADVPTPEMPAPEMPAAEASADWAPIEIPSMRIAEAEQAFRAERRRATTAEERAELVETLIDEEILFRHALDLGLHEAEVPRRRLAQIATFVGTEAPEPGDTAPGDAVLARRAVELGLHEGDFVTRRVLIDAARRLVRGAGRLVEPSDEAVSQYLLIHGEHFRGEDRFRLSHVLASGALHDDPASVAAGRLERLRGEVGRSPDAVPVGDPGLVSPSLPLLGMRALERRFGVDFARGLAELPVGEWAGPVTSRHGAHLVFVHEHEPGRVPEVAEVADQVRAILREQAADLWLAARLRQLRDGRTVRIADPSEVTS